MTYLTEEDFRKINNEVTEKMLSIDPHLSFILLFTSEDGIRYRIKFQEGIPLNLEKIS